jgi:hypothetical protein
MFSELYDFYFVSENLQHQGKSKIQFHQHKL